MSAEPDGGPGLVICAITSRVSEPAGQGLEENGFDFDGMFGDLWAPKFPTPELLDAAAGLFEARPHWDGREGPRPRISIAPGVIALERPDLARRERAAEKAIRGHRIDVDLLAARIAAGNDDQDDEPTTEQITGWSPRSRARMIRRMAEIDWTPMLSADALPGMVTLTYPGDWEQVAPDGACSKCHVETLFKRYARAWGAEWVGVWKLEFQFRGAPHYHLYMVPPLGKSGAHLREEHERKLREWVPGTPKPRMRPVKFEGLIFREWLSLTWADIVNHPDPEQKRRHIAAGTGVDYAEGMRTSDPKRLAVYFAKHGTFADKQYQHNVPELWQAPGAGPGRFWGYRGLSPVRRQVEIDWDEYLLIGRTLRRLSKRIRIWNPETNTYEWRKAMRFRSVPRGRKLDPKTGESVPRQYRKVLRPIKRMQGSSGFVTVNDGAAIASQLARLRETCLDGNSRSAEGVSSGFTEGWKRCVLDKQLPHELRSLATEVQGEDSGEDQGGVAGEDQGPQAVPHPIRHLGVSGLRS